MLCSAWSSPVRSFSARLSSARSSSAWFFVVRAYQPSAAAAYLSSTRLDLPPLGSHKRGSPQSGLALLGVLCARRGPSHGVSVEHRPPRQGPHQFQHGCPRCDPIGLSSGHHFSTDRSRAVGSLGTPLCFGRVSTLVSQPGLHPRFVAVAPSSFRSRGLQKSGCS